MSTSFEDSHDLESLGREHEPHFFYLIYQSFKNRKLRGQVFEYIPGMYNSGEYCFIHASDLEQNYFTLRQSYLQHM